MFILFEGLTILFNRYYFVIILKNSICFCIVVITIFRILKWGKDLASAPPEGQLTISGGAIFAGFPYLILEYGTVSACNTDRVLASCEL